MRRWFGLLVFAALASAAPLWAQDGISSEQLKRMYDDAVAQLKAAQDRRNDLARENEKLYKEIASLKRDLEQAREANASLTDKTYQIRAEQAAFNEFTKVNPVIRVRWQMFLQKNILAAPQPSQPIDQDWPLPDHH